MEATKRFFWFYFFMAIMFSCFCIKTSLWQSKCNSKDVKYISPWSANRSSLDFEFFLSPAEQQCLRESQTTQGGENIDTKSVEDYINAEYEKLVSELQAELFDAVVADFSISSGLESLTNEFFKIKTFDLRGGDGGRGGSIGGGTVSGVGGQGGGSGGVAK